MGTRHLILVWYKGKYRIAQYGQSDGYPDGQGVVVLSFVRDPVNLAKLKAVLDEPGMLWTSEENPECFKEMESENLDGWREHFYRSDERVMAEMGDPKAILKYIPHLSISREMGAGILELVANATEPLPLTIDPEFVADGLMCEWAYVVDLDAGLLEVYGGDDFLGPHGRFQGGNPRALLARWALDRLPTQHVFLERLKKGGDKNETEDEDKVKGESGFRGLIRRITGFSRCPEDDDKHGID